MNRAQRRATPKLPCQECNKEVGHRDMRVPGLHETCAKYIEQQQQRSRLERMGLTICEGRQLLTH